MALDQAADGMPVDHSQYLSQPQVADARLIAYGSIDVREVQRRRNRRVGGSVGHWKLL